jgi:diguanylate cyclase (GGDEF)-like protein
MSEFAVCPTCGGAGVIETKSGPVEDDQESRGSDQTASDRDQTWADHDQTQSDRDQRSADEDQQASDDDFAAGSSPATHERSASARDRTSRDRADVSRMRDETAAARYEIAAERDQRAELDDRAAEERDRLARLSDLARATAAEDRARAAADRRHAAQERAEALRVWAEDRRDLLLAGTDELTGAWMRKFGLASIGREIERAGRTGSGLALAFVDVDGLKEVNDTYGHPDGDQLLRVVAEALRASVRSYDVIVRYGGDEFLCAMPSVTRAAARERMEAVAATVAAADDRYSISFGLAELEPGGRLEELIGRADANLLETRHSERDG